MPIVTNVGKADLALASGVSGVLKASGGTLAGATANTDYAPPDSPFISNIITQNTAADQGYCRRISNIASGSETTCEWGDSYSGYFDVASGKTDNVFMVGFLRNLQAPGQPARWWQFESRWVPGQPPNGFSEYHNNYVSIDKTVEYRPESGFINLNDHSNQYARTYLSLYKLSGFGAGLTDPAPPTLTWDGVSGTLNNGSGAIVAGSFSGSGSGLTGLDASSLAGGTVGDARMPTALLVQSSGSDKRVGVNVANFDDPIFGTNAAVFAVTAFLGGYHLGYASGHLTLADGAIKGLFYPDTIGTFSANAFKIITGNVLAATYGPDGSLTTVGAISTPSTFTAMSGGLKVTTGTITGQEAFSGVWFTNSTRTITNYAFLGKADTTLLNVATGGTLGLMVNNSFKVQVNGTGLGFNGATPVAKPSVTGSRGGNAALASLLTALANLGLITDSTTA